MTKDQKQLLKFIRVFALFVKQFADFKNDCPDQNCHCRIKTRQVLDIWKLFEESIDV